MPILHGIILRTRPARSARKYAQIWTPEGSPLKVWTEKQALLLGGYLGQRGHRVAGALRDALRQAVDRRRCSMRSRPPAPTRVLVLPLYPQYAASTTASVVDARRAPGCSAPATCPRLRFVKHYHDDPGYIDALAQRVTDHWRVNGRPDKLVLSFHGVPRRTLTLGDPYHCECLKTGAAARRAARRLREDFVVVTFQSRFGKAEWLQPYTEPTLVALARRASRGSTSSAPASRPIASRRSRRSTRRPAPPSSRAGGKQFHYMPCLNDQHEWIAALAGVAIRHLQGWDTAPPIAERPDRAPRGAAPARPRRGRGGLIAARRRVRRERRLHGRESADCDKRSGAR